MVNLDAPTEENILNLAKAKGVNVDHEADKFRTWHTSKDSRFASWDQAFHTWLGNARPAAGVKVGGKPKDQLAW